ncbi:MAG: hypothetical protein GY719_13210 [bacterium]|nr:hypothetical protein [bacterium]
MSAEAITLHLPGSLYDLFQRKAQQSHRSVEAVLLEAVAAAAPEGDDLPPDLARALSQLSSLNDRNLWLAARDRLSDTSLAELETLNLKQQREGLTEDETGRLAELARGYERVILLRAEAACLLKERGHDISVLVDSD